MFAFVGFIGIAVSAIAVVLYALSFRSGRERDMWVAMAVLATGLGFIVIGLWGLT